VAIAALVMAGGKGTRMQTAIEKPLLRVGDKPMIHRVIRALKNAESINRIIVATTPATRNTRETVRDLRVDVTETRGEGYEQDMQQAIKTLGLKDVVIVAADLPFLDPAIVDRAVQNYFSSGKPALMVAMPIDMYERFGLKASYTFNHEGKEVAPVGLNVIDGRRIDEGNLDEAVFVVRDDDLVYNVNTQSDLELARNHQGGRH
jgi:adenosylcobinamide-phosphate guanylyltransferase